MPTTGTIPFLRAGMCLEPRKMGVDMVQWIQQRRMNGLVAALGRAKAAARERPLATAAQAANLVRSAYQIARFLHEDGWL